MYWWLVLKGGRAGHKKGKSNIGSGLVISNCNRVWWRVYLHTPENIRHTSSQFCQKKKQWFHQNDKMNTLTRNKWESINITA